jgi:hypothetical protein
MLGDVNVAEVKVYDNGEMPVSEIQVIIMRIKGGYFGCGDKSKLEGFFAVGDFFESFN